MHEIGQWVWVGNMIGQIADRMESASVVYGAYYLVSHAWYNWRAIRPVPTVAR